MTPLHGRGNASIVQYCHGCRATRRFVYVSGRWVCAGDPALKREGCGREIVKGRGGWSGAGEAGDEQKIKFQ